MIIYTIAWCCQGFSKLKKNETSERHQLLHVKVSENDETKKGNLGWSTKFVFWRKSWLRKWLYEKSCKLSCVHLSLLHFQKIGPWSCLRRKKTKTNQQLKQWLIQQGGLEAWALKIEILLLPTWYFRVRTVLLCLFFFFRLFCGVNRMPTPVCGTECILQ